ncbi:MAG: Eco57I restriction-modification methylase domain-containing protein [Planctomycetota bacterium]
MSADATTADKSPEPIDPPHDVVQLVDRFKKHSESYRSAEYLETRLRREFLDPFFAALGWDVDNRSGYAEAYKEVIHEDSIKVPGRDGGTKAPDYCFRIGGARKFFVEAKKPSVNIRADIDPAYQLRRYAWSAKLPLSLLTDFEELAVYDCRLKPGPGDASSTARTGYFTIDQYLDPRSWTEIAGIFSKDAILKGSFDRYVDTAKRKRGTAEVDDALLDEIENWREQLAKAIAKRNLGLDAHQLNHVVQATIDRIMFLRIAEDRGIEPYGTLQALANGENTYARLLERFRRADERYNSGLFHFESERGRDGIPDEISPNLQIDDKPLKQILKGLYYPESPYEFSVFAPEILGQVYEQFLGKVIRLTPSHVAKIEEKPEVKKAGGVFYTPTYIVDYILQATVAPRLEGRTPEEVGGISQAANGTRTAGSSALTIVDPACGSGSFLLGAYQFLLDWYLNKYLDAGPEPYAKGKHPKLFLKGKNDWRLTSAERKRILTTHIYGVDIDAQACEVTKLSLLLKVLEGESEETIGAHLRLFHERALPNLSGNIKCGNSLVGPDLYDATQLNLLDAEARLRINAFDWKHEFPEVARNGGFDAVIGNPPYIRIQTMQAFQPESAEHLGRVYKSAAAGNYDVYVVFTEKGLDLLNPAGRLGFILPHKFFTAAYGEGLRGLIADGRHLEHVVHFGHNQIFASATTYTCVMVLNREPQAAASIDKVTDLKTWRESRAASSMCVDAAQIHRDPWVFTDAASAPLLEKLRKGGDALDTVTARIFQGLKTGADPVYIVDLLSDEENVATIRSKALGVETQVEAGILRTLIKGGDGRRYALTTTQRRILFPYRRSSEGKVELISPDDLRADYPLAHAYFVACRSLLDQREKGKWSGRKWYQYSRNQALDVIQHPKLFTPDLAPSASFCIDTVGDICFPGGAAGGYGIVPNPEISSWALLGVLNSKAVDFVHRQTSEVFRGGWLSYESKHIKDLPIPRKLVDTTASCVDRGKLESCVRTILELQLQKRNAKTAHETATITRQIAALESQIDATVYSAFRLTADEIRAIEDDSRSRAATPS